MGQIAQRVPVVCSACRTPTTEAVKGRCPSCSRSSEQERSRRRRTDEPWLRLYNLAVWKRCRAAALERDGHRCRLQLDGCVRTKRLRGHHAPRSVAELWDATSGRWDAFVELATDVDRVITACEPCHHRDDAARRRRAMGGW